MTSGTTLASIGASRAKVWWQAIVWGLLLIYLATVIFMALKPVTGLPIPRLLGPISTVFMWASALGHAFWMLGWRRALVFLVTAFVVGLALEAIGVATGWVYGGYHYSPRLGPQWFGVPVLIPLSWFMVIYLADVLAARLLGEGQTPLPGRIVWLSLVGAIVATAWDVVADPQMAKSNLWVWEEPGAFFGVPPQNFAGWMITSFVVLIVYHGLTRKWPRQPLGEASPAFAALPIFAYGALALSFFVGYALQGESALAVIAFFTMGALTLIAAVRQPSNSSLA